MVAFASAVAAQPPATHTFVPERYYNTFSAAHPPVLRIKPGDRVITTTVDAAGVDMHDKQVTPGGNPQTGPFYIEGAEPGDMIVGVVDPHFTVVAKMRKSILATVKPGGK